MRLHSGKRIGQSRSDLTFALINSFLFHAFVLAAWVFLYIASGPKLHVPPFYQVKLVAQPADLSPVPPNEAAPAPPKEAQKPTKTKELQKAKKTAPKTKTAALPDLAPQKQKPTPEQDTPTETRDQRPATTGAPVAVTAPQQDFKFGWYLALVREKIGQNWRPPPDARDAKARVVFSVNRSGWVEDVRPDPAYSTGTFGFQQAAIRAIRSSNPFPPLPEEFSKLSVEFSVDLMAE
jgi:outer membrane biosynthesis protein TonB